MRNSWQEYILKEFIPQVNRLTLVADPDYLLTEEDILQRLRERGFDILLFEDPVAFSFAYESKYRSKWDNGDSSIELVVVVHEEATNLRSLPYDIFQTNRKLSFNLGDIFPNLSYSMIKLLDRSDLELLYRACSTLMSNSSNNLLISCVFSCGGTTEISLYPKSWTNALFKFSTNMESLKIGPWKQLSRIARHSLAFSRSGGRSSSNISP